LALVALLIDTGSRPAVKEDRFDLKARDESPVFYFIVSPFFRRGEFLVEACDKTARGQAGSWR
jgi:hypothetical protein